MNKSKLWEEEVETLVRRIREGKQMVKFAKVIKESSKALEEMEGIKHLEYVYIICKLDGDCQRHEKLMDLMKQYWKLWIPLLGDYAKILKKIEGSYKDLMKQLERISGELWQEIKKSL